MGDLARPHVIISVTSAADGRVTLNPAERLLDDGVNSRWRSGWPPDVDDLQRQRTTAIEQRHHPTVVLEGSGTFVPRENGPVDLPTDLTATEDLRCDHLPAPSPRWFVVVDGRGRVAWTQKNDGVTHLLVLVSASTPLPYLAYLRREGIPYLCAGDHRVDLRAALLKMRTHLGAECVVSEAGGGLNGALLRAGLVDELHVIIVPMLVGGLGTPSIMDGPPMPPGSRPTRLRTIDVKVGANGSIWTHYEITGDA